MEDSFDPTFHSNNKNDEDNDDFYFLNGQEFHEDDNYCFSEEQINEYTAKATSNGTAFPRATDWKDDHLDEIKNTKVTLEKGRRFLWQQAKTEIGIFRTSWQENE